MFLGSVWSYLLSYSCVCWVLFGTVYCLIVVFPGFCLANSGVYWVLFWSCLLTYSGVCLALVGHFSCFMVVFSGFS